MKCNVYLLLTETPARLFRRKVRQICLCHISECSQSRSSYDANAITFIATKCDDISCSEVIHALRLEDDSHLEEIEAEIESCKEEHDEWTEKKEEAESSARGLS